LKSELSGKHIHWLDVHAHFDLDEQFNLNAKEVLERFGVQFVPLEEANSLLIELPQSISEEHAQHLKTTLQEHSDKRCYLVGHTDQIHELTQSLEHTFYSIETPFNTLKVIECLAKEQSHETATSTLMSQCNFNGKHILLVEDSPINQLIAQEMLGLFGLRVTTADNGEIAVEKAQVDVFDLILMDIQMPEMDGMEATRIIRTDSFNQTTPIVALTANVMTEDVKLYKEIGMDCHLPKPFKPEQLISILETYLGNA
jgi:CheY-like chemotaxis protein